MVLETRNVKATADMRPPTPDFITLTGEVRMPTPGYEISLVRNFENDSADSEDYVVDLIVVSLGGIWAQVLSWKSVAYAASDMRENYKHAVVKHNGSELMREEIDKSY